MTATKSMGASKRLEAVPRIACIEPDVQTAALPIRVDRHGNPLTHEKVTAIDERRRREPEHPETCSPGWCLVRPLITNGRVWHWDGYHRAEVRTVHIEWGLTIQVGFGQSADDDEPVVHLRALENDCNGEAPYDVVMSPAEALATAAHLKRAADEVRDIKRWNSENGAA
ncbi:hypothetical protein [Actinocrispum wychmicini]|uniref:Uncharacterized protein n=1 Tax=Actinocrispum wychmicini TaxID=1213861 RepID=A0A4R2INT6_9PSEU|nr:hypothetical protein [Actinocrispum wychmicini]TCO46447.1 hypothetical protein EV192_11923 [Actinocrispum wychmicini]